MAPRPSSQPYLVARPDQRAALTSPLRLEVLEHFLQGPLAVVDLAERMGRSPASLYYHVRLLERVGLLVRAGGRRRGRREEALYKLIATAFAVPARPGRPAEVEAALKTAAAAFRMSGREMRAAMERRDIVPGGRYRTFFSSRQRARLSRSALAEVNRHIDAIHQIVAREFRRKRSRPDQDEVACSITIALVPI